MNATLAPSSEQARYIPDGDNLISLQARKDLSHLSSFLTKELGSSVVMRLQNEAAREASKQKKKR